VTACEQTRERARAKRAEARRLGLCQMCPLARRRSARPGRSTCEDCAKDVLRRQRARSRRLAKDGLCDRCGLLPRTIGVLCKGCDDRRRSLPSRGVNVTTARRRKERLCRDGCGASAFAGLRCKDCAKIETEKQKARRAERVANGLCYRCGRHPAPAGRGCKSCVTSRRSKRDRRTTPAPLFALRCGACGGHGHKKSARRCPLWRASEAAEPQRGQAA
jgi:hypothetical protein